MKRVTALRGTDAISLALLLGLVELALRVFDSDGFYRRTHPGSKQNRDVTWARVDPDLGWVFSGTNTEAVIDWPLDTLDWHGGIRLPTMGRGSRRGGSRADAEPIGSESHSGGMWTGKRIEKRIRYGPETQRLATRWR